MKKFLGEFKTFITRGNVLDMAVGVIVGGAFTAIVNAVCNNILRPIVNWLLALIFGQSSLDGLYTFLKRAETLNEAGETVLDLANSIYIDWGLLISAVIQFLLIAWVLFCIVKAINAIKDGANDAKKKKATKAERKEMKALGLKYYDVEEVKKYREKVAAEKAAEAEKAAKEAAILAAAERAANPTTEDLLKEILAQLKKNGNN
ncbi:MAG: large conductance mechanosensitive channel protein MscL [Candidatus Neoclostridium sp.]